MALLNKKEQEALERKRKRTEEITRKVALGIAFAGVFYFFIKLLFL